MINPVRAFGAVSCLVLATVCATVAARAEGCRPLTTIASVDLVPTTDNTWQFVPVSIGDARRLMLLDTGGFVSEITPQAAQEFNLSRRKIGFEQITVAGATSHEAALVPSFTIGRLSTKSMEFVVTPERALFGDDKDIAGVIGPDILRNYDVDVDFGGHKLNLMWPDHCAGKAVTWPAAEVAVLPMHVLPSGHIVVTAMLDGKEERALLDTGASESTLTIPVAEGEFGLKLGSADAPYTSDLEGKRGSSVYKHRFSSLRFGDIAASDTQFAIIPDLVDHPLELSAITGTRFIGADARDEAAPMLIGMNVLRHLHIYVAYKEQKIYITPAGAPAAQPSDSAAVSH